MSLSSFSLVSLKTQKKAKSMNLYNSPEIEIDTSLIKQIGNYRLGEEIGSGAFGKVLLGFHIVTGERVAIKILDKLILSQTPEDYELVRQELNILKIVKHKYIVQLYEILETPQHIFIIMEYCEGQDIMDYILTRGRLSEDESLKFFQQLINALYYLHSQNITHRDIKIDNLLLDRNLDLKLIDFGLSTKYRDDKLLSQPCGTVVYAAPEVLDCKEYHGMLADVWSSGIVLFGMLSGFLPFGDPDDEINKKMVLKGKIDMPKFFSRGAIDLLKHMLDINPLTRYTLEDIMEHPWFNKNQFKLIPGIIIGINRIPIDEKIVNICITYNADREKVRNSVINNKFNDESALYYLLVKKLKACGNDSISDLCSNKFIKYIKDDYYRLDYIDEMENRFELKVQKILGKNKQKEENNNKKNNIKDYNDNNNINLDKKSYNGKENEIDLGAAPGLINEYNFKKYNNNVKNNEKNNVSHNSGNFDDSDIINIDEKDNSSINNSRLKINLGETEFNKEENREYIDEKDNSATFRFLNKGKVEPIILNKKDFLKFDRRINAMSNKNKYNKNRDSNSKKDEKSKNKGRIKRYNNNKILKFKLNKKTSKSNSKNNIPLTSRNYNNNNDINNQIYSTQISDYKRRKIIPIKKDSYNRLNIKKKNESKEKKESKDNKGYKNYRDKKTKLNININININKNILDKKEILTKDLSTNRDSKHNKSPLTIYNQRNKNSYKNKKIYTNLIDNSNDIYNKYTNKQNRSIDSRNKLIIYKNEVKNNLFKTIYKNKNDNNNNPILFNKGNNIIKKNNNLKDIFQNKYYSKSTESRKKTLNNSISKENKETKINKSNLLNLIDNYNMYQRSNQNSKLKNSKYDSMNKRNANKSTIVINNNNKYNYKNDFSFIQSPLLTIENNLDSKNNTTDRMRNIYNLKKQSCFEKENNFTTSNNNKAKSKKKINHNNNSRAPLNSNQNQNQNPNEFRTYKIKDIHTTIRKLDNLNIKDFNNTSYSNCNTKINNSLGQTALNTIYTNNNNTQYTKIYSNTINNDRCNTSRINASLKYKNLKEKNDNNLHKKMNTSILSSINQSRYNKRQITKKLNVKLKTENNNNSKINSLIKLGFDPNYKMNVHSLSKNKYKEGNKDKDKQNKRCLKKNHHLESSVAIYRKKSPFKIRDLSDSPKQKYLNEKTRNNRIPWKIKKKGIDDKLDGVSIYNRYINQFQIKKNNPFNKRNILKKKYKNKIDNSFLNNSKIKTNNYPFIPSTSNHKTLNISFSNYNNINNNLFWKHNENNQYNPNGTSQGFYKYIRIKNIYYNNMNKFEDNKIKDSSSFQNKKIKQNNKFNIQRRNERNIYNGDYNNLTQNYNSHLKYNINEFPNKKTTNESIKKKFNKSISFGSFHSLKENSSQKKFEFEEPFDLCCLFISNNKISDFGNIIGYRLKKMGINWYQKRNIIYCQRNGYGCQIIINKFNNIVKNKNNNKNLICYKIIDKKNRSNNKTCEIISKMFFNSN